LQDCGRNITPPCLKALYGIPNAYRKDSVNQLGLYESGDVYAQADLDLYYKNFAPYVPQGTHPLLDSIDGGVAPVPAGSEDETGESVIDMDIAFSLIYVSLCSTILGRNGTDSWASSHKPSHFTK
jgi:tripeptidyl-peptidase-1